MGLFIILPSNFVRMQHVSPTTEDLVDPSFNPARLFQHDSAAATPTIPANPYANSRYTYSEDMDFLGVSDYVNPRSINYSVINPPEPNPNKRSSKENILILLGALVVAVFVLDGITGSRSIAI